MSKKIMVLVEKREDTMKEIDACREICKKSATVNGKIDTSLISMAESLFWKQVALMDDRDVLEGIGMPGMGTEIEVAF